MVYSWRGMALISESVKGYEFVFQFQFSMGAHGVHPF